MRFFPLNYGDEPWDLATIEKAGDSRFGLGVEGVGV